MIQSRRLKRGRGVWTLALLAGAGSGCHQRVAVDHYPPGVLRVRYIPAGSYTECLLASTVMCANYVTDSRRFSLPRTRDELQAAGLDATRVADMARWLASDRLTLQPLTGQFSDQELVGLGWWLNKGRYPVICVMNKHAGNAEYNHAVVVIGTEGPGPVDQAQAVFILNPASPRRIERLEPLAFRHYWNTAGRIMLPLYQTPPQALKNPGVAGASP
ncbi:MAG: hypothetical protein ACE5GE_07875 [Phycisphaerae bacterium]